MDFKKYLAQTTPFPVALEIVSAKGSYLLGKDGKSYLDFTSGIAVSNLGHGNERIKAALKNQIDKHLHVMVYGEYQQEVQTELGKTLIDLLPANLEQLYLVNSGTEANEAALKLAKRFTGRNEIISFNKSYHGSTHGSLSVSGNETKKYAFRPLLPNIKFIDFNIETQLSQITDKTACVIMETIQGDAGVRIPSSNYMKSLREKCTEMGALLILDEIQVGMGRTGKLFAFEHYNISPDILTIGKAFGAGMPIGGLVASTEIMQSFTSDPILGHITTFGGHPVICAAALEGLKIMQEESIVDDVERKGALLESLITHSNVIEIRRKGLLFAIELKNQDYVQKTVEYCRVNEVLSFWFLSCPESFRIAPPLTISDEDLRKGAKVIWEALELL